MKLFVAVLSSVAALALLPVAWDLRSPCLFAIRPWALKGLIALPLSLILADAWVLRASRPGQHVVRVLAWLGLVAATVTLIATLAQEARFYWVRHQILNAAPERLEKLGRHLIVGYLDLAEVQELVRLRAVAGIFLSARNVRDKSVAEIRHVIRSLQSQRKEQGLPPLWIATDQEGGIVSRLSPPLTHQPSISEIVKRHSDEAEREQAVRRYAQEQAQGLAKVGVNLNFSPVVDLNYQVVNPEDRFTRIYRRAIARDPAVVAQVALWYCDTLEKAGICCTLKHFPGLGRVYEDTHKGQANLAASVSDLTDTDWVPFRTLMRETDAFLMLSHVRLKSVDSESPVSVSHAVIDGLIRGEWKHDGVLITDNFTMQAIYGSRCGMDNGSVQALNAGVDLILVSYDPDQYYRIMYALLKAHRHGKLSAAALHRSDRRLGRAMEDILIPLRHL